MYENREFFIEADGMQVHAKLDFPENQKEKMPLLVVLHGVTGHMEEPHIIGVAGAANQIGFATLRAELYGHGKSEGAFRDHTILLWMTQAMRIIDYAAALPFVMGIYLAGHSQGGLLTVLAGGLERDRLKGLIPLSPAMVIAEGAKKGRFLQVSFDTEKLPESFMLGEYELGANYIRAARMLPVEEAIELFEGPVLIIHGTKDEAVPYEYGVALQKKYRNAELVTIPDDDHCYNLHLDMVTDSVARFLAQQEGLA